MNGLDVVHGIQTKADGKIWFQLKDGEHDLETILSNL